MEISSLSSYIAQLQKNQSTSTTTESDTSDSSLNFPNLTGMDMYIPSEDSESELLSSGDYNELKKQSKPMMPPPPKPLEEEEESTADTNTIASAATSSSSTSQTSATTTQTSLLEEISSSMRVNEDSILSTMEELGLTEEDLSDPDNLEKLLEALQQGAKDRGLATTSEEEMEELLAKLQEQYQNMLEEDQASTTDESTITESLTSELA